jgi:hypothetical protein
MEVICSSEILVTTYIITARVTNLRRKKFQSMCLGFIPSLPPETKVVSGA